MLIGVEGQMGTGKTLTAVALTVREHLRTGRKIFSTVKLFSAYDCSCGTRHREDFQCEDGESGAHHSITYTDLTLERFYQLYKDEASELQDSILLMDESYLYADARLSGSKVNRFITSFIVQTRKRRMDVFLTTHALSKLDRRVREEITHLIRPRHNRRTGFTELFTKDKRSGRIGKKALNGANYYAFYDTEEIIRPQGKLYTVRREDLI